MRRPGGDPAEATRRWLRDSCPINLEACHFSLLVMHKPSNDPPARA